MKKTRNLFVLLGNKKDIQTTLDEIRFKGLTVLHSEHVSLESIYDVFKNNKSVVCKYSPPVDYDGSYIPITIANSMDGYVSPIDCINLNLGNIAEQFQKIADSHNCDIGDHYSNSSGLNGVPSISDCSYCNYILKGKNGYRQRTV